MDFDAVLEIVWHLDLLLLVVVAAGAVVVVDVDELAAPTFVAFAAAESTNSAQTLCPKWIWMVRILNHWKS